MLKRNLKLIFLLVLIGASVVRANFVRVPYEAPRALGMGNAFTAVADDSSLLWYNPAGLAYVKGIHFNLFDISGGVDSPETLGRVSDAIFQGKYANLINSNQSALRFSVMPSFYMPYFGLTVFNTSQGLYNLQNLSLPNLDIYAVNDLGAMAGIGIPFGDHFAIGASVKVFMRSGIDQFITTQQFIADLGINSISNFNSAVNTYLQSLIGTGYGIALNAGTLIKIPFDKYTNVQLAATADDLGTTTIRSISALNTPPAIPASYHLGAAVTNAISKNTDLKIAVDYRDIFSGTPFFEKFHAGIELRWRVFKFRTGYYDGYPTVGLSIEAPPQTKINLTSYCVEKGSSLWESGTRVYLAQVIIGFNPF